jgi:hypothetical protein
MSASARLQVLREKRVDVRARPAQSISAWLEQQKAGYGLRFAEAISEVTVPSLPISTLSARTRCQAPSLLHCC